MKRAFVLVAVDESELAKRLHELFAARDCLVVHLNSTREVLAAIHSGELVRPDLLVWRAPSIDGDTAFILRRLHRRKMRVLVLATFLELVDAGARRLFACSWRSGAVAVVSPDDEQVLRHLAGEIAALVPRDQRTKPNTTASGTAT